MANRALVEKEIKEYCTLNNINDIPGFITQCLLRGFNIFRYGVSPADNIKRQNGDIVDNGSNRTVKSKETVGEKDNNTAVKKEEDIPSTVDGKKEPVIVRKKRKITVTNVG